MLSQIAKITDDQNPDRAKVIEGKIIGDFSFLSGYLWGFSVYFLEYVCIVKTDLLVTVQLLILFSYVHWTIGYTR